MARAQTPIPPIRTLSVVAGHGRGQHVTTCDHCEGRVVSTDLTAELAAAARTTHTAQHTPPTSDGPDAA